MNLRQRKIVSFPTRAMYRVIIASPICKSLVNIPYILILLAQSLNISCLASPSAFRVLKTKT